MKEFIRQVVASFNVGPQNTQVALIQYSTFAQIEFKMTEYPDVTDLLDVIDNVTYSGGATLTSDALQLMRTDGFEG